MNRAYIYIAFLMTLPLLGFTVGCSSPESPQVKVEKKDQKGTDGEEEPSETISAKEIQKEDITVTTTLSSEGKEDQTEVTFDIALAKSVKEPNYQIRLTPQQAEDAETKVAALELSPSAEASQKQTMPLLPEKMTYKIEVKVTDGDKNESQWIEAGTVEVPSLDDPTPEPIQKSALSQLTQEQLQATFVQKEVSDEMTQLEVAIAISVELEKPVFEIELLNKENEEQISSTSTPDLTAYLDIPKITKDTLCIVKITISNEDHSETSSTFEFETTLLAQKEEPVVTTPLDVTSMNAQNIKVIKTIVPSPNETRAKYNLHFLHVGEDQQETELKDFVFAVRLVDHETQEIILEQEENEHVDLDLLRQDHACDLDLILIIKSENAQSEEIAFPSEIKVVAAPTTEEAQDVTL